MHNILPLIMNSRDFYSPGFSSTFPKASEMNNKPKLKIPDLSTELYKDQKMYYQFDTSITPPPLSTTSCFIQETTNSDPHLIRSTMYVLPDNPTSFDNLNIPFGVSITPFSFKSDSRRTVGRTMRCMQCLSYANIHWKNFEDKIVCNICKYPNIIKNVEDTTAVCKYPTYEVSSLHHVVSTPRRLVDSEYFQNAMFKCPAFIFIIDTSYRILIECLKDIRKVLEDDTFISLYKRVVFMTTNSIYGSANGDIIEYKLENSPFIPPNVFIETDKLNEETISKIFNTIEPTKKKIESAQDSLTKISRYSIGTKVVIFSDIITMIEEIPNTSVYLFPASRYHTRRQNDLLKICTSESVFNVTIEVKTSNGISRNTVYTSTEIKNMTSVEISSMDCCSTVMYTFYIDEYITDSNGYIQFIIKYVTHEGEYKTLVLNQAYKISKQVYDIYNGISFDTLFSCFCKYITKDIQNIKHVEEMICKYLKYYRKTCCKDISVTQFVLPDSTKLLPVLYQALVKNKIFSVAGRASGKTDDMKELMSYTVDQNLRFFYPRLFTLTDYYIEHDLTKISYLRLSMSVIDPSEIYVMENGQKIYLYMGKEVDPELKEALFTNEEEYGVLMKLVDDINGTYGYELPVVVVEEGKKGGDVDFYGYMVEDSLNGVCSYYDYVCELHFKVQNA
jgi:protein transport protein SEC24